MRYFVTVNGEAHEVELVQRRGTLEATFDGEPVDARYLEVDRLGQAALFLGDRAYAISIEGTPEAQHVTVAGRAYGVFLEDERERAAHAAERARGARGGEVKSVMPGVVIDVLVREGDRVEAGQPLLILEAMKMQNEIAAPSEGRVARLYVERGEAVKSGARLVALSAE